MKKLFALLGLLMVLGLVFGCATVPEEPKAEAGADVPATDAATEPVADTEVTDDAAVEATEPAADAVEPAAEAPADAEATPAAEATEPAAEGEATA